jgi:hypothetical protein
MKSAIEKAVMLAEYIPPVEIKRSSMQLALVSERVERGLALRNNLFGVEEASKPRVKNGLAVLKRGQMELQNCVTFGTRYRLLSMEPLTWRDKNGWPRLVVFSLDSPRFEIALSGRYNFWRDKIRYKVKMFPKLPNVIAVCYEDVQKTLRQKAGKRQKSVKLFCCFKGLIPEDIKQKIAEARELFKEIFLIAEPKGFKINETAIVVPKRDPLVVGFDGSQLWLIAVFDTAPVEEAMIFLPPGMIKN